MDKFLFTFSIVLRTRIVAYFQIQSNFSKLLYHFSLSPFLLLRYCALNVEYNICSRNAQVLEMKTVNKAYQLNY